MAQWIKRDVIMPYLKYTQPKIIPPAVAWANLPSLHESLNAIWANPNAIPTKTITKMAFLESSIFNEDGLHKHFRK